MWEVRMPDRAMPKVCLQVQGLEGFYGETQALHGVDFEVHEGEVVCLLGRNGAGKTTSLRAIVGLLSRRRGQITIHGQPTDGLPPERIARLGVAYCPEERGIFASLSVEENLLLPPVLMPGGMSVEEIYQLFPNLLKRRTSPGAKLSGGEQQMLAIARILRTGAKLLLLDEPTEGLAPVIVEKIGATIQLLQQRGFTILMVEQNFRFASRVANRFYVIEEGCVSLQFDRAAIDTDRARIESVLGL
jgi:branched-chain amino acid transport system ATP-binding protein